MPAASAILRIRGEVALTAIRRRRVAVGVVRAAGKPACRAVTGHPGIWWRGARDTPRSTGSRIRIEDALTRAVVPPLWACPRVEPRIRTGIHTSVGGHPTVEASIEAAIGPGVGADAASARALRLGNATTLPAALPDQAILDRGTLHPGAEPRLVPRLPARPPAHRTGAILVRPALADGIREARPSHAHTRAQRTQDDAFRHPGSLRSVTRA